MGSCAELRAALQLPLPQVHHMPDAGLPDVTARVPICALEGVAGGGAPLPTDLVSRIGVRGQVVIAHVMYEPADFDPAVGTYLDLRDGGGIDIALDFASSKPESQFEVVTEADPDNWSGGYAPFELRGERAAVQQLTGGVRAAWWEDVGSARAYVIAQGDVTPAEMVALAQQLEPPG